MRVSIIIPAYNSEKFISNNLKRLDNYLENNFKNDYEIILINDGSDDKTVEIAESIKISKLKVLSFNKNQGKFAAIKYGVSNSCGECIVFTDADLPYDLETIGYIEKIINERKFHIVIGDRSLIESTYTTNSSNLRRICTTIFSLAVRMFVTGGLYDTQCGIKGFRKDVAHQLFLLLTQNGFSADVELLYISSKYNLEIKRIPVRLINNEVSTVRVLKDGILMVINICKLKINWAKGKYHNEILYNISSQAYWSNNT